MNKSQKGSELLTQMRIRMGRSYQCFLLYKAINFRRNSEVLTRDVIERNNKVFSRHLDFFVPVSDSLLTKAIIDLYIFFDSNSVNYSYKDLLSELKPECNHLTYEKLEKKIDELFDEVKLEKEYLTNYRHSDLAHEGKNKKDHQLAMEHINSLFVTTQEIFNLISGPLENSETDFALYTENDAFEEIDAIFRDLDTGFTDFVKLHEKELIDDLDYKR